MRRKRYRVKLKCVYISSEFCFGISGFVTQDPSASSSRRRMCCNWTSSQVRSLDSTMSTPEQESISEDRTSQCFMGWCTRSLRGKRCHFPKSFTCMSTDLQNITGSWKNVKEPSKGSGSTVNFPASQLLNTLLKQEWRFVSTQESKCVYAFSTRRVKKHTSSDLWSFSFGANGEVMARLRQSRWAGTQWLVCVFWGLKAPNPQLEIVRNVDNVPHCQLAE